MPESRAELEKLFGDKDTLTVDPSALERRFTIPERNRAIVREYRQVLDQGYIDAKGVLRKPLLGKAIVFAVTKKHAETLARLFDAEFAHLKPSPDVRFADYVVSGQGADDTVDGMSKIRRFKKETFPQILVSVNMLDTGFDCPEVVSLVFARFTRSSILYRQMRGRGTRKARNKPTFTMFDFVGVADYHGDDNDFADGGVMRDSQKRRPYKPRRLLALDIDDHIDPTTREWVTVDENGIVRLRREAQQKADELIPAIFIDMFGEPATNPNAWPVVPMSQLVGEFRYGTSQKSGPVGVPVLRIPNVVDGAIDLAEVKFVAINPAEHERLRLVNGDLLFVRTNGNPDFVGRCSVYDSRVLSAAGFDGAECVFASYLIRARLADSSVSPAYLQAYLSSQRGRQLLRERAKTSAGQFNLNIDGLGSLPVPAPPQSLQRRFIERLDRVASIASQHGSAKFAASTLFGSLLARAFGAYR